MPYIQLANLGPWSVGGLAGKSQCRMEGMPSLAGEGARKTLAAPGRISR